MQSYSMWIVPMKEFAVWMYMKLLCGMNFLGVEPRTASIDAFSKITPPLKRENNFYGYHTDEFDPRDWRHCVAPKAQAEGDEEIETANYDLRLSDVEMPEVYSEQRNQGSNAVDAVIFLYQWWKMSTLPSSGKTMLFKPARDFVYWNHRYVTNTTECDSGTSLRTSLKVLHKVGVCDDVMYMNTNDELDVCQLRMNQPNDLCYTMAAMNKIKSYHRVPLKGGETIKTIKNLLVKDVPVAVGFRVFSSFEEDSVGEDGLVPMPEKEEKVIGGHCAVLTGFDDETQRFTVRNSWGKEWGDNGYFYLPYEYVANTDYCKDLWCISC